MKGRKRLKRKLVKSYDECLYQIQGIISSEISEVSILDEEIEALRLQYIESLSQKKAARKMHISQSQFQRDVTKAIMKITEAFITRKNIRIKKVR